MISFNGAERGGGVIFFGAGVSKKRHSRHGCARASAARELRRAVCDVRGGAVAWGVSADPPQFDLETYLRYKKTSE